LIRFLLIFFDKYIFLILQADYIKSNALVLLCGKFTGNFFEIGYIY